MDKELLTRIRKEAYEQGYQDGKVDGYNLAGAKLIKRKKGKWLNKFVDGLGFNGLEFECSECGKRSAGRTNYCAYCGAEMCK